MRNCHCNLHLRDKKTLKNRARSFSEIKKGSRQQSGGGVGEGSVSLPIYLELSRLPEGVAKVVVGIRKIRLELDGVTKRPDRQLLTPAPTAE